MTRLLIFIFLFVLSMHSVPGQVETQPVITIHQAIKKNYLGDPLTLNIYIRNPLFDTIWFLNPVPERFGYDGIEFSITAPGGVASIVDNPDIYDGPFKPIPFPFLPDAVPVLPGETRKFEIMIHYNFPTADMRKWLFPVPGKYKIETTHFRIKSFAYLSDKNNAMNYLEAIRPESVHVEIRKPADDEYSAYLDLKNIEKEFLLYSPESYEPEWYPSVVDQAKKFIEKWPSSRYAKYCSLLIAASVAESEDSALRNLWSRRCEKLAADKDFPLKSSAARIADALESPRATVPVEEVEPLIAAISLSVADSIMAAEVITDFFRTLNEKNLERCAKLLSDDFLFRESLNRSAYLEELREDFAKGDIRFEQQFIRGYYWGDEIRSDISVSVQAGNKPTATINFMVRIKRVQTGGVIRGMD